jgi:hypothetical protein
MTPQISLAHLARPSASTWIVLGVIVLAAIFAVLEGVSEARHQRSIYMTGLQRRAQGVPSVEGGARAGWIILLTKEETEVAVDSIAAAGLLAGLIPEPTVSKAMAVAAGLVAIAAKVAKRKGLCGGVRVKLHGIPTSLRPSGVEMFESISLGPKYYPFFYAENDPASLQRWRVRFRLQCNT